MTLDCRRASDLLSAFADGGLDPALHAAVARHVAACEACTRELAKTRDLLGALRQLSPGPVRSEADWGDFSRSVRLAFQRSVEEDRARTLSLALPRRLWRLLFGAGTALALGTAAFVVVERTHGPSDTGGGPVLERVVLQPGQPARPGEPARPGAGLRDDEAARLEAAGRLGDLLGDADPDELLDELDDEQLERVGKALTPGA